MNLYVEKDKFEIFYNKYCINPSRLNLYDMMIGLKYCRRCCDFCDSSLAITYCLGLCKQCYNRLYPFISPPINCVRPGCTAEADVILCQYDSQRYIHCSHIFGCSGRPLDCFANQFMIKELAQPCNLWMDFSDCWFQSGYSKVTTNRSHQYTSVCFLSHVGSSFHKFEPKYHSTYLTLSDNKRYIPGEYYLVLYRKQYLMKYKQSEIILSLYRPIADRVFELVYKTTSISMRLLFTMAGQLASQLSTHNSYLQVIPREIVWLIDKFMSNGE